MSILISIIENLFVVLPALLIVAFVTIAERKTMASMQRRLGPVWWLGNHIQGCNYQIPENS